MADEIHIPVLIVGGGPVGLALAADLGWRGIACLLVEQGDGTIAHPRANAENARTMEFFRRWEIADRVREAGTPKDYPHTVLYLTALTGFEIARIERPGHGGRAPTAASPERPQRCNQLWLDPILRERAASFPGVTVRLSCRFEQLEQDEERVVATVRDLATGERQRISAHYLVACCGGHSSIPKTLGVAMQGNPTLEYNLNIFFRTPQLWSQHDKGKAALHFFVDAQGIWRTLVQLDGRELWRLSLNGKSYFDAETVDASAFITGVVGKPVAHEVVSALRWVARDLVADKYRVGRVFLAGDAAHQNTPSGGFGLNTGMGDAADLGWKLAAALDGWGGRTLLDAYEIERKPVAERIVKQATGNYMRDRRRVSHPKIAEDSAEGARARREMGEAIVASQTKVYVTDGTALGYVYDPSPICCADGTPPAPSSIMEYRPTTRPGARAPHAWLPDGRSTLDLFGRGFVLLRLGDGAPEPGALQSAFARRGVPLAVVPLAEPRICEVYERRLVLVRPDGHVAWRSDAMPEDPLAIVDRVRGA